MRNEFDKYEKREEKILRNGEIRESEAGVCPGCGRGCSLEDPHCGHGKAIAAGEISPGQKKHDRHGETQVYDDRVPGELREADGPHHGGEGPCAFRDMDERHGDLSPERQEGRHGWHGGGEVRRGPEEREGGCRGRFGRDEGRHGRPHPLLSDDGTLSSLFFRAFHSLRQPGSLHGEAQDRVLRLLAGHGEISQRMLQEHLAIQPGSLSELLSKMEGKGLLLRETDETDRRRTLIRLSEEGQKEAGTLSQAEDERRFAALTAEERDTLRSLLQKLADARGPRPDPFFDEDGRLTRLPGKRGPRLAALRRMAERFETGRDYKETEVNGVLRAGMTFGDVELVRRELIEAGLLARTGDGSRYWRTEDSNGDGNGREKKG